MILICPCCGGAASLEAWTAQHEVKAMLAEIFGLPPEIAVLTPSYLGFFRSKGGQPLHPARARHLTRDFSALVSVGKVVHGNGVWRPCPPAIWVQALEQLLAQRAAIKRPLANHNYLRSIAYGLADKADAQREQRQEEELRRPRDAVRVDDPPRETAEAFQARMDEIRNKMKAREKKEPTNARP